LEREKGQSRKYPQTRRTLSAQPIHRWRAGRYPLCQDPWHQTSALAYGIVGAAADQGRRDRARQQDRKNGVGHDGQGGLLQRTRRTCGVTEIAPTISVM